MFTIAQLLFIPALLLIRFLISYSMSGLPVRGVSWSNDPTKWHHTLLKLKDDDLKVLALDTTNYDDFNNTLDNILVTRVPGTKGHESVRKYIFNEMEQLGWAVEEDAFVGMTPFGKKPFRNIIATLDPNACRHLTIACHYDSLHNREYTFLGAVDSAVPCSMMIHAAKLMNDQLQDTKQHSNNVTLQFIFFDGEEAFETWSRDDSLYGSRHLANKWNRMKPFPHGLYPGDHCDKKKFASYLDRMDVMVLLDLIGSANPTFYSYFPDTYGLYIQLIEIEDRLNALKLTETHPPQAKTTYFNPRSTFAFVEDDHIPFMQRGVPIIHLIPNPFPSVWHRESDNRESLDHPTINNLNKMLRIFIAEYLHIEVTEKQEIM